MIRSVAHRRVEREIMIERQREGIAKAKAEGEVFLHAEGLSFKKKPCCRPSRPALTWPASVRAGKPIKAVSTHGALSSSTKPG